MSYTVPKRIYCEKCGIHFLTEIIKFQEEGEWMDFNWEPKLIRLCENCGGLHLTKRYSPNSTLNYQWIYPKSKRTFVTFERKPNGNRNN